MKKRIEINVLFTIFLFFALTAIFTDFIEFIFATKYVIELIVSILLSSGVFYLLRKKVQIKYDFEKSDIIFLGILFFIGIITIVFPDKMYDTINYHLFNQVRPFEDKINYSFFPSSLLQSYSYAYGDRIFYIFRYIFGYRLGILLNYLIITVLYYQIKGILKNSFKIKGLSTAIISMLSIFSLSIIDMMDNYYIDLISLVLVFELLDIVVFKYDLKKDKKENSLLIYYIALLSGLSFAVKISNIFFVIAFAVIFFIRNIKNIKNISIKDVFIFIIIFLVPSILYIYTTYKQTGNPVFPFYNTVFNSNYFPISNWMDKRFGPHNILEVILWPILAVKNPERSIDVNIVEPILAIGYIMAILYLIYSKILKLRNKNVDDSILYFSIIVIFLNIIWANFLLGYIRYGLIIIVINSLLTFIILNEFIKSKKYIYVTGILIALLVNSCYSFTTFRTSSGPNTYNNYLSNGLNSYKYNLKKMFTHNDTHINLGKDAVWVVWDANSGIETLLNDEIPIIFINYDGYFKSMIDYSKIYNDKETKKRLNVINQKFNNNIQNKKMYTVVGYNDLQRTSEFLNIFGYSFKKLNGTYKPSFANYYDYYYVFELGKKENANNYLEVNSKFEKKVDKDSKSISCYIGLDNSIQNIYFDNYKIEVLYNNKAIYSKKISTNKLNLDYFKYDLDTHKNNDSLIIHVLNENNEEVDWVNLDLLNYVEE